MSGPVVSGEGVALELARAGVGSRIVATVIDLLVQAVLAVLLLVLLAWLGGGSDTAALAAAFYGGLLLVVAGYPILFEWLTRGRTLGKLALGLRVVRDDGGPIAFRHALVRGLASLVLEKPGMVFPLGPAAGLCVALFGGRDKRIGDLLAGTFVLNERTGGGPSDAGAAFAVPPFLQAWAATLDLTRVDDALAAAIRQFLLRAPHLVPAAQHSIGEQLRVRVEAVLAPPPPPGTPTPYLLTCVLAERRRRAYHPTGQPPGPLG